MTPTSDLVVDRVYLIDGQPAKFEGFSGKGKWAVFFFPETARVDSFATDELGKLSLANDD